MWIKDVDNYIDFEEAYHLYSSFVQFFCPEKQAFRNKLLDEIHGLPVYVITQPIKCKSFVALKNSSDMEKYLVDFTPLNFRTRYKITPPPPHPPKRARLTP